MIVDVELTVWCEGKGSAWCARITDGPRGRFYSGSADTPLEAIAWALDEYVCRALLGLPVTLARNASDRPGDRALRHRDVKPPNEPPPSSPRPTHYSSDRELDKPSAKDEIGCFEQRIPPAKRPRLAQQPLRAQRPRSA